MNTQSGRSMVEMLGVLAIIGVLSVGAIAGYGKAMMKYRINQIINTANQLVAKTLEINSLNIQGFKNSCNYTKIFVNAGYAPDGFTYSTKTPDYLHDIFGNPIWIFKSDNTGISFGYGITHYKKDTCYAMLNFGKEWKSDLFFVSVDSAADIENNIPQKVYGDFFGDDDCKSGRKCLSDLSLKNIGLVCDNCDKINCRVYYVTKPVK